LIPASEPPIYLSVPVPGPGGSRVFDSSQTGSNAQSLLTPASAIYNNLQTWTSAAWVYPVSTGGSTFGYLMVKDPFNTANNFVSDFNSSAGDWFCLVDSGASVTIETVPLNQWTHIVSTFDLTGDKKIHIYFNGIEATYAEQFPASSIPDDSGGGFMFGNETASFEVIDFGWDGRLSEIAIWNTVLSGAQITAAAASTTGVGSIAAANLVGYWHLCGTESPEPDSSGNGNSAVLSTNPPIPGGPSPGYGGCGSIGPSTIQTIGRNRIFAVNADQDISILFGNSAGPSFIPSTTNYRIPANQQTTLDMGQAFDSFKVINDSATPANVYIQLLSVV
jgi:hypothetical protein